MTVLVLGFGPFAGVAENPSSRLARALDASRVGLGRHLVVGVEMPVSYERAYAFTLEAVRRVDPAFVLGIGVAPGRPLAMVERVGRNRANRYVPDVDGVCLSDHGTGTLEMECPVADAVAHALGVPVSDDAGDYVCNSWIFRALRVGLPAAFLHVPSAGLPVEQLAAGLGSYLDGMAVGG